MAKKIKKLLLVDGHAFAFRAYYAFASAGLKNSKTGLPSGAVFGFFRMLFKLLQDFDVSHIAIAFDPGTRLDRNDLYEPYKANRKPMPEDLRPQIDEILKILEFLQFPVIRIPGKEADDIIGTLCKKFKKNAEEILIFSSDKDLYQILDTNIHMLRGKKGVTEFEKIDPEWVKKELGILTQQVPDFMGIVGDTSDNIPGVKGIGEKGASELIQKYGTLEKIYDCIEEITSASIKTKLLSSKENAFLSRKLATIDSSLDIEVTDEDLKIPNYLEEHKILYFKRNGYNVLFRELAKQAGFDPSQLVDKETEQTESIPINNNNGLSQERKKSHHPSSPAKKGNYKRIHSPEELKKILSKYKKDTPISIDTETTSTKPHNSDLLGISFSWEEATGYYVPVSYDKSLYSMSLPSKESILSEFKNILENPNIPKIGQNIKYDWIVLEKNGIHLKGVYFDTMVASYLLNPSLRKHNLDALALDYLGYFTMTYEDLVGKGKNKQELYNVDPDKVTFYASEDADIALRLYNILKKEIQDSKLEKIFYELEMPLIEVLKDIEITGVKIDTDYFSKLSKDFDKKIQELEKRIHIHAGKEFNIASTKELQVVLFDDLHLPIQKKTQTGFSTDHSVLESLLGTHPIIEDLLLHRKYTKLKSTYIDALPNLVDPITKKIHTSYNQALTATGRLSSQDPNLQNIPIKDEEGRWIRRAFIPSSEEYEFLSLDYSQIELRIMAHYSQDPTMLEAYKNGDDIHRKTAAAIFGVDEKEVTPDMRNKAKIVNFSIIYGATGYGLSQNLKIPQREANQFIKKYFEKYKNVRKYMDNMVAFCEKNGYVETLLGRRRYIPEIHSSSRQEKEQAKRIAINTPIQGTSADMIKLAMLQIHKKIKENNFQSRIILQVHDELVFEVHKKEKNEFYSMAKDIMTHALPLSVPIVVEGKFGKNWDEAH